MSHRLKSLHRSMGIVALAGIVGVVAGCDTSVTNPGPTPDEFLDDPVSQSAVVAGAFRALSDFLNTDRNSSFVVYHTAALTFEINPAGSTGSFGIPPVIQGGTIPETETNAEWQTGNEARFVAEDAFDRFTDPARAGDVGRVATRAQIALAAGFANRILGEVFCEAVLPPAADGKNYPSARKTGTLEERSGSLSPHTDYLTRAEQWFTIANDIGSSAVQTAARAGRAAVRALLGNWSGAASDAASVADDFVFLASYSDQDQDQFNALSWASALENAGSSPYRAHTQWATFAENYFFTTGDSRMAWDSTALQGDAAVAKFGGRVPWFPQAKHPTVESPVRLASGWEMRLIEAEAALDGGNAGAAVDLMNMRRADLSLPLFDNTVSADSAWSLLKLERQVELWLEGRRMGDVRRWTAAGRPGAFADGLYDVDSDANGVNDTRTETLFAPVARSLCFPVARSERETNPNVPLNP